MNDERYISKKSERFSNIVLGSWALITLTIACLINYMEIDMANCSVCDQLSLLIPAVNRSPLLSDYYDEARAVWLFLPLSSVLILFLFFRNIKIINYDAYTTKVVILLFVLFFLGVITCVGGFEHSGNIQNVKPGIFIRLFSETLIGMAILSWGSWTMFIISIFYLSHFFKKLVN